MRQLKPIVVVDDEPNVRSIAARVLASEGFDVLEAADGAEALWVIGRDSSGVALVVSDIVMPRVNGIELVQRLAVSHPQVPVVLMSGYGTQELAVRGIAPPCGILTKPFPPAALVAEVRRCLTEAA